MTPVTAKAVNIEVLDPDGAAVAGIVVYVETKNRYQADVTGHMAIDILQKNKGFEPYISVVSSGTRVTFTNHDDITHHIYSVTGETRFSYTIRAEEKTPDMTIDAPGLIAMGCNIHDWMNGYLLVLQTPHYALTDERGQVEFNLDGNGRFQVAAWHPQLQEAPSAEFTLPEAESVVLILQQKMKEIPRQQGVDDFDFLEGY